MTALLVQAKARSAQKRKIVRNCASTAEKSTATGPRAGKTRFWKFQRQPSICLVIPERGKRLATVFPVLLPSVASPVEAVGTAIVEELKNER
jgi:hypothetical protein